MGIDGLGKGRLPWYKVRKRWMVHRASIRFATGGDGSFGSEKIIE